LEFRAIPKNQFFAVGFFTSRFLGFVSFRFALCALYLFHFVCLLSLLKANKAKQALCFDLKSENLICFRLGSPRTENERRTLQHFKAYEIDFIAEFGSVESSGRFQQSKCLKRIVHKCLNFSKTRMPRSEGGPLDLPRDIPVVSSMSLFSSTSVVNMS
jgi:hypothetical protein